MHKTQWIELYRTVRKSLVTFLAIVLFVTMGASLFFGLVFSGDAIALSGGDTFSEGKVADLTLYDPYGFPEGAVADCAEVSGVAAAEGYYEGYEYFEWGGTTFCARITTLTEKVNIPLSVVGDLPEASDEIAVDLDFANDHGIRVGDTLVFRKDNDGENPTFAAFLRADADATVGQILSDVGADTDGVRSLLTDTFKVTALLRTASYLSRYADMNGVSTVDSVPVGALLFTSRAAFDEKAFGGVTHIAVRYEAEYNPFEDGYRAATEELTARVTAAVSDTVRAKRETLAANATRLAAFGAPDLSGIGTTCDATPAYDNPSVLALSMTVGIFDELKYSMAGLFVLIGLLVCFFAVYRIVTENTVGIGTEKALGFTEGQVCRVYLLYAGAAALVGGVIGALGARFIVEPILLVAIADVYRFSRIVYEFRLFPVALYTLAAIGLQMLTVRLACRKLFRKDTLSLLTGDPPHAAKERFFEKSRLWKRRSLFTKTVVNNCLSDRRRVLSTVVGIASCCALVVCALTLNDHIVGAFDKQYDEIFSFDGILYTDSSDFSHLEAALDEEKIPYTEVYFTYVTLQMPNGKRVATLLYVPEDETFGGLVTLAKDGESLSPGGLYSSCSYASEFGAKPGDGIRFTDVLGEEHTLAVSGFFDYYLISNLLILDPAGYEAEFGSAPTPNTLFLATGGRDFAELSQKLADVEGFLYLSDDYANAELSFSAFADVFSIIVAVYLAVAVAMALLVLLNLFTMFVTEKRREVITLRINGFSTARAKIYLALDTAFLTVPGILAGLLFGTLMAHLSLGAYENESIHFLSGIDPRAFLIGAGFTVLLTFLTSLVALSRVRRFDLTSVTE